MADKEVIVIDETEEETLTVEEIEELNREKRLKKLFKTKNSNHPRILIASRVANVIGIFGIMFSMLTVSGTALVISLSILLISTIVNYFVC